MSGTLPPPPSGLPDQNLYRWLYLAYQSILNVSGGSTGTFGPPGITTPNEALVPGNQRELDYLNLDNLLLDSEVITSTGTEINQLHNSNITTESLQNLASYDLNAHTVDIQVGIEIGNVINVACQFFDVYGQAISSAAAGMIYYSNNPLGTEFATSVPDTSTVAVVGELYDTDATGTRFQYITDTAGTLTLDITESGADTFYLVFIMPYGKLAVSQAITFT